MKKKFLQGILTLSTAAAICFGAGMIQASAETLPTSNIAIDYQNQKLTVTEPIAWTADKGADLEVLFGVSTVNAKKKTINTAAWEVYELKEKADKTERSVTIDISSLKNTADNYLQIKGDKHSDPLTIKIPKAVSKIKGTFNALDGTVSITDGAKAPAAISDPVEYRTQFGDWTDFSSSLDFKSSQQRGSTLYFRVKAGEDTTSLSNASEAEGLTDPKAIGEAKDAVVPVYTVNSFPSVEAKVAVAKLANAPKATADFIKRTVKTPAKSEYRVILSDATVIPESWVSSATATTLTGKTFTDLLDKGGVVEVRTAATDKKPASKIGQLELKAKVDPAATDKDDAQIGPTAYITGSKYDGEAVVAEKVTAGTGRNVGKYTVTLVNSTTDKYEVYIGTDEPTFATKPNVAVAAAKADSTKSVTSKLFESGSKVYIRKVGNKTTGDWTSEYEFMGLLGEAPATGGDDTEDNGEVTEP